MTLANRLRQVMDGHDITQEQLAKLTGISQVSIQKILTGQTRDPKFILEIARVLDADPYWLKFGERAPIFTAQVQDDHGYYQANPAQILTADLAAMLKNGSIEDDDIDFLQTAARYIAGIRRKTP